MSSKQTTMGDYFSRASKDKTNVTNKDDKQGTSVDRKTRFTRSTAAAEDKSWDSWMFTDWKKKDADDYRNHYPGKKDDLKKNENWKFYNNEIRSYPDGDFIDNIHKKWMGDYQRLERHHGYIQWLFPLRESAGMNFHAQELQKHEIEKITKDPKAHRRVLKSYKMMLDFYGMKLKDETTGEIVKAENWRERFAHLNRSYHNYLRITRILKCLGELGYEHIKVKFLEFVIEEALEKKTLKNCYKSCQDYWVETLRIDEEREHIKEYMRKVENGYESGEECDVQKYNNIGDGDMDESQEMKYIKETVDGYDVIPNSGDEMSSDETEANKNDKTNDENQNQNHSTEKVDDQTETHSKMATDDVTNEQSKVEDDEKNKEKTETKEVNKSSDATVPMETETTASKAFDF